MYLHNFCDCSKLFFLWTLQITCPGFRKVLYFSSQTNNPILAENRPFFLSPVKLTFLQLLKDKQKNLIFENAMRCGRQVKLEHVQQ